MTGTDEHGEKIAAMAKKQFKKPSDFVDEIAGEYAYRPVRDGGVSDEEN